MPYHKSFLLHNKKYDTSSKYDSSSSKKCKSSSSKKCKSSSSKCKSSSSKKCKSSSSSSSYSSSKCSSSSSSCSEKTSPEHCCKVDDHLAKKIECLWKKYFCTAMLLPKVGYPSKSGGVGVLTHQSNLHHKMKFNKVPSKSPLANNALYSFECSKGVYINLYETMIVDIPGDAKCGELSTGEIYTKALSKYGLIVNGKHFHWDGASMVHGEHGIFAIHHKSESLSPYEFSKKTIKALLKVEKVIKKRLKCHDKH